MAGGSGELGLWYPGVLISNYLVTPLCPQSLAYRNTFPWGKARTVHHSALVQGLTRPRVEDRTQGH